MLRIVSVGLLAFLAFIGLSRAQAAVLITVDKTAQQLSVAVDGFTRYQWPVSTARWGYRTPNGTYRPQRLARKWFSRKYDWSPMPYSIFFNGGYAIHGSYEISHLGRPASHGCIRLHPENAAVLFALVQDHIKDTEIVVTGDRPAPARVERRARARHPRGEETYPQPGYRGLFDFGFGPPHADEDRSRAHWERQ
ncbi:MAG TPA: L,D-transpeptidase [Pseudolabrys sp.]|nr:L,D-transpeptidase [Pseudolabrys sp.]